MGMVLCAIAVTMLPLAARADPAEPDHSDALLDDLGRGWRPVGDQPTGAGVTRTYQNSQGASVQISAVPAAAPGVRAMFELVTTSQAGELEPVPEPSLDLATWLVSEGEQPGDGGLAMLAFASHDYVFFLLLDARDDSVADPLVFVRDVATRQIAAAGGAPPPPDTTRESTADDELASLLPDTVPAGFELQDAGTLVGSEPGVDPGAGAEAETETARFLDENVSTATRVWVGADDLAVAVAITRYPYGIFAAANLGGIDGVREVRIAATGGQLGAPDAVLYEGEGSRSGQVGTVSRRGNYFVDVLVLPGTSASPEQAAALAIEMTQITANRLPEGKTTPYDFPSTLSKFSGAVATAGVVTACAGGSLAVARLRARRVRKKWEGDGTRSMPAGTSLPPPSAVGLDPDARHLRRQGAVMTIGQLVAVNVSIGSLAGEFGSPGIVVAVLSLVAGLALTRWWQRRELGLLGSKAPPKEFALPRPAGAILGVIALAVIVFGFGVMLKGLQYTLLDPTLTQLKWSERLSLAPRTVGYVFSIGGFVVAVLGGALFRVARAFGRQGTQRVLAGDARPAALYLRSFEDDRLPLPVIASARRPLFELFSLRGADPFEEAVAWELNSYGPVVAVGRPGRSLASLGAAREHLPDATWREQVAARMDEAGIIAVATGETDGLAWELGKVVDGGHLGKTFFVFPPVAPAELERRWRHTSQSLGRAGVTVGELGVPVAAVHTVHVRPDGSVRTTYASRRDEATYRTAVDRTLTTTDDPVPLAGPRVS